MSGSLSSKIGHSARRYVEFIGYRLEVLGTVNRQVSSLAGYS